MSVTFFRASSQPVFSAVATAGLPVWEAPFDNSTDRVLFRQRFMQTAASYSPATMNVTYPAHGSYGVPTSTSFYLVGEDGFRDESAGLLSWDRVYAAVPTTRYDYTSIAYQYPAVLTLPVVTGSYVNIGNFGYGGVDRAYVTNDGTITFSRGDTAVLSYRVVISGTTNQMNNFVLVRDASPNGGAIVDLPPNFFDPSITVTRQIARAIKSSGRPETKTMVGRAVIEYSYALVTPAVTPVFTFNARQTFTLDGAEVDFVNLRTSPSISTYAGWISAGSYFNAEDDTWARWKGNIYERRSVKVVAL